MIRSTQPTSADNTTTPIPPVTTTAKSSFFSGIRNIFLRTTTVATTTTTKGPTSRPVTYAVTSPRPHTPSPILHNHGSVNVQNPELAHKSDNWPSLPAPRGSQSSHALNTNQQNGSRIPVRQPSGSANPSHFIQPNIEISKRGDTHSRIPVAVTTRNHDIPTNTKANLPLTPLTSTQLPPVPSGSQWSLAGSQSSLSGSQSSLSGSQSSLSGSQSSLTNRNNNSPGTTRYPQLATTQEIEELSELLFKKQTTNIFPLIKVNLQKQTRSSFQTDDAPLP